LLGLLPARVGCSHSKPASIQYLTSRFVTGALE
jgi:hypothetical protein